MADNSKHKHSCGCGGKTKAGEQLEPDFTLNPVSTKANEAACCGHDAVQDHSDDQGCCGDSQSKQPKTKAKTELSARGCCGGHGHD